MAGLLPIGRSLQYIGVTGGSSTAVGGYVAHMFLIGRSGTFIDFAFQSDLALVRLAALHNDGHACD